jgi:hypothetical protein
MPNEAEEHELSVIPLNTAPKYTDEEETKLSWLKRLTRIVGTYAIGVLFFGTIFIYLALGFICYLWINDGKGVIWQHIMMHNMLSRSITLATVIIRWAITGQAMVCTAMLAALALERHGVRLGQSAAVSMLRYDNSGPFRLLTTLLRGSRRKRMVLAVFCLCVTTVFSQFFSTALLSDLFPGMLSDYHASANIPFGMSLHLFPPEDGDYMNADYWTARPNAYATFAEYSEPAHIQDGIADTGVTLRGLLPLGQKQNRELLQNYTGMATVFDARITCQSPDIEVQAFSMDAYPPFLKGKVNARQATPRLMNYTEDTPQAQSRGTPFACLPASPNDVMKTTEWKTTICVLNGTAGGLISEFSSSAWAEVSIGYAYLVLNMTYGTTEDLPPHWNWTLTNETRRRGEWLDLLTDREANRISVSLCYSAFDSNDVYINAFSNSSREEPNIHWDSQKSIYHTDAVRKQLGATRHRKNFNERGIWEIQKRNWLMPRVNPREVNDSMSATVLNFLPGASAPDTWKLGANVTAALCTYCFTGDPANMLPTETHNAHVSVFQDAMKDTGNLALALQAHFTTTLQMAYYDTYPQFNVTAPADMVSFVEVLRPMQFKGFAAVHAVIHVHVILCFLITIQFLTLGRFSILGNVWHAVSQLFTEEVQSVLVNTSMATDDEVYAWLKKEGKHDIMVDTGQFANEPRIGVSSERLKNQ